jgi:hypothetical protein
MHASFPGTFISLIGLIILLAAWPNSDWLFDFPKAKLFLRLEQSSETLRKQFMFCGAALLVAGLLFCLGLIG